jgi:hypothetical protein
MATRLAPRPSEDDDQAVSIWQIAKRLGHNDFSPARIVRYLKLLQTQTGFPPPFPAYRKQGGNELLISDVCAGSTWSRMAVDAWFADYLPAANARAVDHLAARAAASDMDQAASSLRLVKGQRG